MKKYTVLFSVMIIVILIFISSCKKNDNSDSVTNEKKKYAWVTGEPDSTGYGMILFTPDAGETWMRQGQGSAALQGINVSDIWAVDENNVWATGSDNVILKTNDGGTTWTIQPSPLLVKNCFLVGIDNWDNQLALIVSTDFSPKPIVPIIKTDNGGVSWENKLTVYSQLWKVSFIKD